MRLISFLLALILFLETKASSTSNDATTFKHHTFEFSVTPAFDYYFITHSNLSPGLKQQTNDLLHPFLGCNFGFAYIYRPIKYFGISTGIGYLEYINKLGKIDDPNSQTPLPPAFYILDGYTQSGYLSVPIQLHSYMSVKKTEIDFASGPEFSFPIYNIVKYTQPATAQPPYSQTQLFSTTAMRQQSIFGWGAQLTVSIPIKNLFCISVGPEIKLLNIRALDAGPNVTTFTNQINYYTGVKICFRMASNFAKKTSITHN